jgi:hypothetical protein
MKIIPSVSCESWKLDIKNLFKIWPKVEDKIMKQVDEIKTDSISHKSFKIDIEDKNKKYEIIIKIKD